MKRLISVIMLLMLLINVDNASASSELAEYEMQKGKSNASYYTWAELDRLAHIINGEAGSNYCSDEMKAYVGSVVLNRVKSDRFPNTIKDVIFQPGQYACTWDGNYNKEPSDACYEIAEELLVNGSVLPKNVLFQAEFIQGDGVYIKEQNMYFCYKGGLNNE